MNKYFVFIQILTISFLSGCSHYVQTTSGISYLKKYDEISTMETVSTHEEDTNEFTKVIEKVASVEPILRFPARIGVARIDNGKLSTIPEIEFRAWVETEEKLGRYFGEFIPVSPLVASMAYSSLSNSDNNHVDDIVNKIRLGAARQHLDAVLVYEVYSNSNSKNNILAIANLSIIGGYILPSKEINSEGFANAILIDVIQGYPYGTAQTIIDKKGVSTLWNDRENRLKVEDIAKTSAAIKLMDEVKEMFIELRLELAEKRADS